MVDVCFIAAFFITIRDIVFNDFIKRYDYIGKIIANIIIFIGTMIYVFGLGIKIQKPNI